MPNWCAASITVTGDDDLVARLRSIADDPDASEGVMQQFVPIPAEIDGIHSGSTPDPDGPPGSWVARWRVSPDGRTVPVRADESDALIAKYGADCPYDFARKYWGVRTSS